MKANLKTSQEFKQEVVAYLDKVALDLHNQAAGQRNVGNWDESVLTDRRAGAYESAAQYVRAMETHKTN